MYCNYSKDKFGNELTFILPPWMGNDRENMSLEKRDICGNTYAEICFKEGLVKIEKLYLTLLKEGWKPQEARDILPLCTKGEAVMTGFVGDWWGEYLVFDKETDLLDQRIHGMFWEELDKADREKYRIVEKGFFPLRCDKAAHPQARELAIPLREEFKRRKYIK